MPRHETFRAPSTEFDAAAAALDDAYRRVGETRLDREKVRSIPRRWMRDEMERLRAARGRLLATFGVDLTEDDRR